MNGPTVCSLLPDPRQDDIPVRTVWLFDVQDGHESS